jgi:hypothetical protein
MFEKFDEAKSKGHESTIVRAKLARPNRSQRLMSEGEKVFECNFKMKLKLFVVHSFCSTLDAIFHPALFNFHIHNPNKRQKEEGAREQDEKLLSHFSVFSL